MCLDYLHISSVKKRFKALRSARFNSGSSAYDEELKARFFNKAPQDRYKASRGPGDASRPTIAAPGPTLTAPGPPLATYTDSVKRQLKRDFAQHRREYWVPLAYA